MNKRELEEELKRTSTGRKLLEETEFANHTNDMIRFAKEQCEIFPEDSYMGKYLRETIKILQAEPCEDVISRQAAQAKIKNICNKYRLSYEDGERKASTGGSAYALGHAFDDLPPVKPISKKCKWILYDYRTLVPREHGNIPNPYWRIPARYKVELKYCPYCGCEIDYSEVDADIEKRRVENDIN